MSEREEFRAEVRDWLEKNAPKSIVGMPYDELNGNWGGRNAVFDPPEMTT